MPQAGGPGGVATASPAEGSTYVGIDTLQEQTRLKALRRGYTLNLMVVGRSGLGKSTLVNTLFKTTVSRRNVGQQDPLPSTTEVKTVSTKLSESGVHLNLTITDTPGFGDYINNENCWEPVVTYIKDQYARYLQEEQKVERLLRIPDSRIHCCLYFISPTGHSLSCLDIEVLKRLHKIANVVPVIAKADTLTIEERTTFKDRIRADLADHGIRVYPLHGEEGKEEENVEENMKIRERLPFAVVGSTAWHDSHGKKVLARRCSWGLVEVENRNHNDFAYLRDMLIRTHMQDLMDTTAEQHYETFRRAQLSNNKQTPLVNGHNKQNKKAKDLSDSKM